MTKIYLVVGTPGSGKSWVCNQLADKFEHLPHDDYNGAPTTSYLRDIQRLAEVATKPILIETPFSVSQILEPLSRRGHDVVPIFIIESEETTKRRYEERDKKPIPQGHLSRIATYKDRAERLGAFSGTSAEVLNFLKGV